MSIELATQYSPYVDETFKSESKTTLITNNDYDWTGAHTVKVWKVSTVPLNDYTRNVSGNDDVAQLSRFGKLLDLNAQTEEMILKKDRSFIFNIDKLDADETQGGVESATALAREVREVVVPEVDSYTYGVMAENAGTIAEELELTADNVYDAITEGTETMDDAEVPDTERVIVVTPSTYRIMKKSPEIIMNTDISAEKRALGVIGMVDGLDVVKVPASRLPVGFGFMICHPSATTAPMKLEDYGCHPDTPLSSGTIVTGRICYDAFVLENKALGIYYQPIQSAQEGV